MAKNKKYLNDHDLLVAAFTAAQTNQHAQAIKLFKEALKRDPGDPFALIEMGKCYHSIDDPSRSRDCLEKAAKLASQDPSVGFAVANAYQVTRDYPGALKVLEESSHHSELKVAALTRRAELFELCNDTESARQTLDTISAIDQSPATRAIAAKLHRRNGDLEQSKNILQSLIQQTAPDQTEFLASLHYELASVHDKLDEFPSAVSSLKSAKSLHINSDAYKISERGRRGAVGLLSNLCSSLTADKANRWRDDVSPILRDDHTHGFLLGHPRSGTTLIEQSLDAHPDVQGADETSIFHNTVWMPTVLKHTKHQSTPFPDFLDNLPQNFTRNLRNTYRQHWIQSQASSSRTQQVWLDKNPALTTRLAIIAKFFPEAPIIFALRDPRDVVISSFMQPVGVNDWSINWLTMEETVDYYCFAMQMWLDIREKLANPWTEIRYEDCISDIANESRRASEQFGLQWSAEQVNISDHVKNKTVYSPTYGDVGRPLYKSSIARWRNYSELIAPFEEKLAPFIDAFGYQK